MNEPNDNFLKIADLLPLALILCGYILTRTGIDNYAITMHIGFICYGLLGLITLPRLGYHKKFSLRLLKVFVQPLIVILAVMNILWAGTFIAIVVLILCDRLILRPSVIGSPESSE
jgi:hypothetical protein